MRARRFALRTRPTVHMCVCAAGVTVRCAPFSPKNRHYPAGCHAALRELHAVLAGSCKRSPKCIIYEILRNAYRHTCDPTDILCNQTRASSFASATIAGLWRKSSMRALVEAVLRRCVAYKWEALKLSPHTHTGSPVRRIRVFYVGIYTDEHSEADGDGEDAASGDESECEHGKEEEMSEEGEASEEGAEGEEEEGEEEGEDGE